MNAAAQLGDETVQRNAERTVQPHPFIHGTSGPRQNWFRAGYASAQVAACETFGTNNL